MDFKYHIANIIGFFVISVSLFFRVFINLRFGIIYTARVGHLCQNVDAYLSKKEKSEIAVFGTQKKISNKIILENWKQNKGIYFNKLGFYGYFFLKNFFPNSKILIKWSELYQNHSTFMLHRKNFNSIFLENDKFKILNKLKIFNNPYICFHNRDNSYLNFFGNDGNDHTFRNFKINDFRKSIRFINKKKIKAIRVGRISNQKMLMSRNKYYLEFINKQSDDFTDLFLINNCEFFVSSATGISNIASILRKKILLVNLIPFCLREMYQWTKGSIFIPKKIYSIEKKRLLKFSEIENLNYDIHEKNFFKKKKLRIINNTQEEILEAVKEMLQNYKKFNNKKYKNKLHKNFWKSFKDQKAVKIINGKLKLNICDSFLRKNRQLI